MLNLLRRRRTARSRSWARNRKLAHRLARNRRSARSRRLARSNHCSSDAGHAWPSWPDDGSESAPSGCRNDASDRSSCRSRQAHNHKQAHSRRWARSHKLAHKPARNHKSARSRKWAHNHRLVHSSCRGPDGDRKDQPQKQYRDTTEERPTGHTGRSYDSWESLLDTRKQTAGNHRIRYSVVK